MGRKICFFDLDNTLLDDMRDEIPLSALEALSCLRKNHVLIVIASGRDMDTHYSVKYRDIVAPDAIIHQNGFKITIDGRVVFEHDMDERLLKEIYDFCLLKGICIGSSIGGEDFFIYPEKKTKADLMYKKESVRNFVPFEEIFKRHIRVRTLSYAGDVSKDRDLLEKRFPRLILYPFAGNMGADLVERGISKADGMRFVSDYFGTDMKDTYAFGDASNDIPMLITAGTGVAMGNASEEVQTAADYVTTDIEHDGIRNALMYLGLI